MRYDWPIVGLVEPIRVSATPATPARPEPRKNKTAAAMSEVMLASMIVPNALWKPASIDWITERPCFRSSRIRS